MIHLGGLIMIVNTNQYYIINNKFKKGSNILYKDFINVNGVDKLCQDHRMIHDTISVDTEYSSFHYEKEDKITFKDLFHQKLIEDKAKYLYLEDSIVVPKYTCTSLTKDKFESRKYLFLNYYNYSTSFNELVSQYNLPRSFLLKALSTGCPDEEWTEAKEWNDKLKEIIKKLNLKDEIEFRNYIVSKYSNKLDCTRYRIRLNSVFASLLALFVCKDYSFKSNTVVELYCHTSEVFSDVISFVLDFKFKHTVRNFNTNRSNVQIISINSSLFYEMFSNAFENLDFLLEISPKFSNLLFNKIKNKTFYLPDSLSSKYLKEFLFRNNSLYKEILSEDGSCILSPIFRYKEYENYYLLPITKLVDTPCNQLIKLDLK